MNNVAIKVTNLTNKFGDIIAVNNVNLTINIGEKIAILGANGAGKTTLIETIIGTTKPTSGKVERFFSDKKSFKEDIGVQFQDAKYPPGLKVSDIIEFINEVGGAKLDKKVLNELLEKFHMKDFYANPANSLSGGQAQKLNVLLALINNPKLLILDEVSTGLDVQARSEIKKYIKKYIDEKHTTLILVSHDMNEVELLCDRVIALKSGKLVFDGTIAEISKKHQNLDLFLEQVVIGE